MVINANQTSLCKALAFGSVKGVIKLLKLGTLVFSTITSLAKLKLDNTNKLNDKTIVITSIDVIFFIGVTF